jgi:hypothetical protein
MYLQNVISKKTFFVDVLQVTDENSRIRIRIQCQTYGSADPDPYQNFMYPQHLQDVSAKPAHLEEHHEL